MLFQQGHWEACEE